MMETPVITENQETAIEVDVREYLPDSGMLEVDNEVVAELAKTTGADEWNSLVEKMRQIDPSWAPDFSHRTFAAGHDVEGKDFSRADFREAQLSYVSFINCDLTGANLTNASIAYADFRGADLTGVNMSSAFGVEQARNLDRALGFRPPLRDVTEEAARYFLNEAINDPDSDVNEGLKELAESNINFRWSGDRLKFWMCAEIEEMECPCKDYSCECEIYHACEGSCDCCSCYTGDCECEGEHTWEVYETGRIRLATVIGEVEYVWSDLRGLRAEIKMHPESRHPHVSPSGVICWGDSYMEPTIRAADCLLRVMGWIGQHNPIDPYREIEDLPLVG
jgi:hypothetical protein